MKKIILVAAIAAMFSLTACGPAQNISAPENETVQVTENETVAETEAETEETTVEETTEASVTEAEPENFTPVEGLSENYADLDNRCFAYDGKIFTLGKTTLQEMVDAGLPFSESELNNIGNNVNKNHETGRYTARVNNYVSLQFTFLNMTDSNITEKECLLSNVRWYTLYVPKSAYSDSMNEEIKNYISDASKHVGFSFPLTLTKDQLLENNSDTTKEDEYNNVEYKVDSDVYMGSSGYRFEFDKDTNQMKEVSISWLP